MLARWQDGKVFERSLDATAGGQQWTFYEGPPTANGMPGVHHIEARVFKDVFPRFKTMQGFHVPRQGGWDCHGLPVEVAVEQELGLSGKKDIEAYGIAEFNARCRESVLRHVDAFEELTTRLGYWVDLSARLPDHGPELHRVGLVVAQGHLRQGPAGQGLPDQPVLPALRDPAVRPRDGPARRVPDGDRPVGDGPVPAAHPARRGQPAAGRGRPAGLDDHAVDAGVQHRGRRAPGRDLRDRPQARRAATPWWSPSSAVSHGCSARAGTSSPGCPAPSWSAPPTGRRSDLVEIPDAHRVVPGTFVTTEDGTGLVHLAPAFGADDMETGRAHGLPVVNPIRPDGRFEESRAAGRRDVLQGRRRAAGQLTSTDRGLLFQVEPYEHSYPHCWRCHTPLLYYALPSWYIRTTQIKDQLLAENERTNWQPPTIKHGRYGEWLRNNVDWALSRTRYWGTPLPIWECGEQHLTCVELAGRAERAGRAGPVRPGPAPAVRGRRRDQPAASAARRPAGCPR